MSCSRWMSRALAASVVLGATSTPLMAAVIIGDWENATDGWIDWGSGNSISTLPAKYAYSAFAATSNTNSLQLTQSGFNQNLAIKLQNNGLVGAFLANNTFSIDVTAPATTVSGFSKIESLIINAQGYGFQGQPTSGTGSHLFGWGTGGGGPQTYTLSWNYAALIDGNTSNGEITATASSGYVELVLTTNSDSSHGQFYFDNARFSTVPEPTTAALAAIGATGLLIRRRRGSAA